MKMVRTDTCADVGRFKTITAPECRPPVGTDPSTLAPKPWSRSPVATLFRASWTLMSKTTVCSLDDYCFLMALHRLCFELI